MRTLLVVYLFSVKASKKIKPVTASEPCKTANHFGIDLPVKSRMAIIMPPVAAITKSTALSTGPGSLPNVYTSKSTNAVAANRPCVMATALGGFLFPKTWEINTNPKIAANAKIEMIVYSILKVLLHKQMNVSYNTVQPLLPYNLGYTPKKVVP
jgi:hypothetical protein